MKVYSPTLFVEINSSDFIFAVGDKNTNNQFNLIYKSLEPIQGIENYQITNFDLVLSIIKKNIYSIEQKVNFIFKDMVLIINNFNCSFINLTGFKKLNGSQILKENITYILNSLKSNIDETENKKTILHIFNSNYNLDKKKIENLPIGLFGDFYSHELSFCLINNNDYKNLNNIFNKCNLKIKKFLVKSFIEGSDISNENENLDTFYQIKINKNNSQIFYFENDSLKFEQNFDFGSDLVLRDIAKVTSLKIDVVKFFLNKIELHEDISKDEVIEKELFNNENYVRIKKKLIFEIAKARIQEFSEKFINKNINLKSYDKKDSVIFIKFDDQSHYLSFKHIYKLSFSLNNNVTIKFLKNVTIEKLIFNVDKIINYGWRKEAVPVTHAKKSIIAKFFDALFG
jgi:cell division protein FtsA